MKDYTDVNSFSELPSYIELEKHFQKVKKLHMRRLFSVDASRFENFSINHKGLLLDYSKNRITKTTLLLLFNLAKERNLLSLRDKMFTDSDNAHGLNHSALRQSHDSKAQKSTQSSSIEKTRNKIHYISNAIRSGELTGYSGKKIKDVVNIGVDEASLGAITLYRSLKDYRTAKISTHFISNTQHINALLKKINPETTLFIISSMSFTNPETLNIASTAKKWMLNASNEPTALTNHFIAISSNYLGVQKFGIEPDQIIKLQHDHCYSIWGGIGLSTAITIGMEQYEQMLEGAHSMDQHFKEAPIEQNMPIILALLGVWYCNFFKTESHGIFPYDHRLSGLPRYIGQFDMQANSRSVNRNGEKINYSTGSIIIGTTESNTQHAFYQALHQGLKLMPCDFIAPLQGALGEDTSQHNMSFANMLAQSESLMRGRNLDESYTQLPAHEQAAIKRENLSQLIFEGNNPSNTLLLDDLSPFSIGMLLALYEHKAFVQSVIWGIKSTEHQGIEFEQHFSNQIMFELDQQHLTTAHDSSTNSLIEHHKQINKKLNNQNKIS